MIRDVPYAPLITLQIVGFLIRGLFIGTMKANGLTMFKCMSWVVVGDYLMGIRIFG